MIKNHSLFIVFLSYLITLPLTTYFVPLTNFKSVAYWDFLETNLIFLICFFFKSTTIIDFYWKIAPIYQSLIFLSTNQINTKKIIAASFILSWALRLLVNYIRSWIGLNFLDFRVDYYRKKAGIFFWPAAYVIFFLVSGLILFLAKIPIILFLQQVNNKN